MSNVETPNINSGDANNPDLLAEQSGTPNMSSSKTFTVDTNMQVNGDLSVTGTVTATSFVGDGSQLTGITGVSTNGGLDEEAVTQLIDEQYIAERLPEPLTPRYPDVSAYYYIYVGEPAAKLEKISDLHWGWDEEHDYVYDQEFETLIDAFKFVQESNFDSTAWNSFRNSWVKTRIVFVLQNGKVFQDAAVGGAQYLSLTHIDNHIIFTTQYSVDRDGTIDTSVTGYSYVDYAVNFSYCPHIHMGGDIGWHDVQSNGSNLMRIWAHSYNQDVYVRSLWAIRGSHVYLDGIVSETTAEENSYCKIFRVEEMPGNLKTKVEALGISSFAGHRGVEADDNSTVAVLNGYNHPNGVIVTNGSKVTISASGDDIVMGDGTASNYSYNAITVREGSELSLYSHTFNPNDATAMPNLVINTGTLTQPTPENNKYITVDWSSKFTRGLPIDTTNAVGVQAIDGWGLVRPDLPELP